MKRIVVFFAALMLGAVLPAQDLDKPMDWMETSPKAIVEAGPQAIPVVDFEGLLALLQQEDNRIRVINFWATWCAPCIEELPYFEEMAGKYGSSGVEVFLVSLDFPAAWEGRLPKFIRKKGLKSPVIILDDPDQNSWIPRVDPGWSGAIPATLIYRGDTRAFYETTFDRASLEAAIESFIR